MRLSHTRRQRWKQLIACVSLSPFLSRAHRLSRGACLDGPEGRKLDLARRRGDTGEDDLSDHRNFFSLMKSLKVFVVIPRGDRRVSYLGCVRTTLRADTIWERTVCRERPQHPNKSQRHSAHFLERIPFMYSLTHYPGGWNIIKTPTRRDVPSWFLILWKLWANKEKAHFYFTGCHKWKDHRSLRRGTPRPRSYRCKITKKGQCLYPLFSSFSAVTLRKIFWRIWSIEAITTTRSPCALFNNCRMSLRTRSRPWFFLFSPVALRWSNHSFGRTHTRFCPIETTHLVFIWISLYPWLFSSLVQLFRLF